MWTSTISILIYLNYLRKLIMKLMKKGWKIDEKLIIKLKKKGWKVNYKINEKRLKSWWKIDEEMMKSLRRNDENWL